MQKQDLTSTLLKRLEDGTAEIYSRYQSLIRARESEYDRRIKEMESEYAQAANEASARAKIDLNNTLERMADSGYIHAGETVQAQIAANASRANALGTLAAQKAKSRGELEGLRAEETGQLALEAEEQALAFRNEMTESIRDQVNRDREYQAESAQRAFENRLATQRLEWEKEEAEKKRQAESAESKKEEEGIRPAKNAYEYLEAIVEKNTTYHKDKGYKVINRTQIQKALSNVVRDSNLSLQYRYEMYLYAKSMGYLEE